MNKDIDSLVISPLENMFCMVKELTDNPMAKVCWSKLLDHLQKNKKRSNSLWIYTKIFPKFASNVISSFSQVKSNVLDPENAELGEYETRQIGNALNKLSTMLQVVVVPQIPNSCTLLHRNCWQPKKVFMPE